MSSFHNASLDDKGRLVLPVKIRGRFQDDQVVITRGLDRCLWLYSKQYWEEVFESLIRLPIVKKAARDIQRRIIGEHHLIEVDKIGRINIPNHLMIRAGLRKFCALLNAGTRLELWDADLYSLQEESMSDDEHLETIVERDLGELGGVIL